MYRKVDELKPHSLNAEIYGDLELEYVKDLIESIRRHGIKEPLVVKPDGTIISGHRRWQAAMALGIKEVPCRLESYANPLDEQEALIEYNRQREKTFSQKIAEAKKLEAIERERALKRMLAGKPIQPSGNISGGSKGDTRDIIAKKIGFGSGKTYEKVVKIWNAATQGDTEAKALLEQLDKQEITPHKAYNEFIKAKTRVQQQAAAEAVENVVSDRVDRCSVTVKPGEWWRLGAHILYCGDTSKDEFISALPCAAFAFADPPYNVGVAEWDVNFKWQHDWLIDKAKVVVVTPGINSLFNFARDTTMPYVWSIACWETNGMTRGAMGFGNWIYAAVFSRGSVHRNSQDFVRVTINNAETYETQHRGRKPAGLLIWLIETFSKPGDIVIDPFLGSGTTLLAAEKTGRRCYGGEINPDYCAEIITRWQKLTGRRAEVVGNYEDRLSA